MVIYPHSSQCSHFFPKEESLLSFQSMWLLLRSAGDCKTLFKNLIYFSLIDDYQSRAAESGVLAHYMGSLRLGLRLTSRIEKGTLNVIQH